MLIGGRLAVRCVCPTPQGRRSRGKTCGMKACRWVVGALLAATLSWQNQSEATVVRAIPLGKLVEISDWVVVATVTSVKSQYVTIGGAKRMVTDATLQIDHALTANRVAADGAGSGDGETVTVRTLGGTIDGVAQAVLGEAVLNPGSTNLLFLRRGNDQQFHVAAMAQGEYVVFGDEQGQLRLRPSPGLDVVTDPEQSVVKALAGRTLTQAEAIVTETASKARQIP